MPDRSLISPTGLAGSVLGGVFGTLAGLRGGKPLHPYGVVYDAVVRRDGSSLRWGARWLDEPGTDHGQVRLSRAIGLPEPAPDILGLALTFTGPLGNRCDLLLATTGMLPGTRFVLLPRLDPRTSSYGSLLPYRTARGLTLIGATPTVPPAVPAGVAGFRLLAAGLFEPWHQFGVLELTERPSGLTDEPLRFDPITYPLPGLRWPRPLIELREPAYAAARRVSAGPYEPGADRLHATVSDDHFLVGPNGRVYSK
jgi:hypothetical protein